MRRVNFHHFLHFPAFILSVASVFPLLCPVRGWKSKLSATCLPSRKFLCGNEIASLAFSHPTSVIVFIFARNHPSSSISVTTSTLQHTASLPICLICSMPSIAGGYSNFERGAGGHERRGKIKRVEDEADGNRNNELCV